MEDKTLNELKQIKIQDQIRDLKLQESKLKTKRRHTIGFILQMFAALLAITIVADLPFYLSLFVNLMYKFSEFGEAPSINQPFSPSPFWWWFVGVILLLMIIGTYRIIKLSKSISQTELGISKRYAKVKQLSEKRYN